MDSEKHKILFTRNIDTKFIQKLESAHWKVKIDPFIRCHFSYNIHQLEDCFENQGEGDAYIFTSKNAVNAIVDSDQISKLKKQPVFAIGEKTADILRKQHLNPLLPKDSNSIALAEFIVSDFPEIKNLTYFCGNIRRAELPEKLAESGRVLKEIEVYKTEKLAHKIDVKFDAIAFYSPSAVDAFFENNTLDSKQQVFAIGHTTANALQAYFAGEIIIPENTATESLIESIIKQEDVQK